MPRSVRSPQPGPEGGPGVLGPWREWPRRETKPPKGARRLAFAAGAATLAVFAHCVAPLL